MSRTSATRPVTSDRASSLQIRGPCNDPDEDRVYATYYQREHGVVFFCGGCGGVMGAVRVAADA